MFTPGLDSTVTELQIGDTVSIDRAAELLKVSRRTVYNRIKDGRLQTVLTRYGVRRVLAESLPGFRFPQPSSRTPESVDTNDRRARS